MRPSIYLKSDSPAGVITQSIDGNTVDLILMHYEVLADPDVCILVNKEQKCSNINRRVTSKSKLI